MGDTRSRFDKDEIEGLGGDWSEIARINVALDALHGAKLSELHVTGNLLKSKIAWKFSVLRQSFIYRMVDLCEGAIASWKSQNVLAALILGRSAVETAAVIYAFREESEKALNEQDLAALNKLAMKMSLQRNRHSGCSTLNTWLATFLL